MIDMAHFPASFVLFPGYSSVVTGAAPATNRLELETTTDDLLLEDGSGCLELEV